MSAANLRPSSQFNNTVGAFTLASLFVYILFGVSLAQVVHYFRHYRDDKPVLKYMVSAVVCLEICHAILFTDVVYEEIVLRHGRAELITKPFWGIAMHIISVAAVDLVVRVFFSYRIWQLSKSVCVPVLLVLFSICSLGIGIYAAIVIMSQAAWSSIVPEAYWSVLFSSSIDIVGDIVIALYMILYLRRRQITDVIAPSTSNLIDTLMIYSISTGVLAVIINSACLIMFRVMPNNFIWLSIYAVIPQVFANSMLVALNARESMRVKTLVEHNAQFLLSSGAKLEVHQLVEIDRM